MQAWSERSEASKRRTASWALRAEAGLPMHRDDQRMIVISGVFFLSIDLTKIDEWKLLHAQVAWESIVEVKYICIRLLEQNTTH